MFGRNHIFLILSFFLFSTIELTAQILGPEDKTLSIYFGGGSYYVDPQQEELLNTFIQETENLEIYQIEVHGHTDNIGSVSFNQYLSEMRSGEVIYYLELLEIDREAIIKYDHGEMDPDYDNTEWQGKLHNRRVDIILRKLSA
ncbi:MAG: outer membrane protein OmpA-like peptidoglycan-associated protein [Saprospiraceae bacterium]|jgi:outer membrane protein OmpA-like peptidoglycan-associated protein